MATTKLSALTGVPVVQPQLTEPTSVTVTGAWVSNATYTATETRTGVWAEYEVKVLCSGAPTAATLVINLPSGRTIDSSKIIDATGDNVSLGCGNVLDAGNADYAVRVGWNTSTSVRCFVENSASTYAALVVVNATTPITFGSGDWVTVRFKVPILEWAGQAYVAYGAGLATATVPGLVKVGAVPGLATGASIAAGYIGEVITTSSGITTTTLGTSDTDITNASITLTAGVWRITYQLICQLVTGTNLSDGGSIYVAMTDNVNNRIAKTNRGMFVRNNGATASATAAIGATCLAMDIVIPLSGSVTYKLRGQRADNQGTNAATVQVNANQHDSVFFAVRVG